MHITPRSNDYGGRDDSGTENFRTTAPAKFPSVARLVGRGDSDITESTAYVHVVAVISICLELYVRSIDFK